MSPKFLVTAALGSLMLVTAPLSAEAGGKKERRSDDERFAQRDCRPINGPYGYYGNPWCDGGYKYAEDYPPGSDRYFDLFETPRFRRLGQWFD